MDKGAHYRKCDFQVHTPRDERWTGGDAIDPPARRAYAEELVLACRAKGVGAIAITDHHDFAFFPYIREAAAQETDGSGQLMPEADRLIVFPGLELTLTSPACQALLILDSDFPDNLFASVLTVLAITQHPDVASRHAPVQRIPQAVVSDLSQLYDLLNNQPHLRDRFVVFPNVSETGHGTLLRTGFHHYYKSMPCVGGYVDGSVEKFGKGNRAIVNGEDRNYGFKSIAVFQTSDNRKRDHAALGRHSTWVKWSEPTAEALRQACLAKESRLSLTDPTLPELYVGTISISNSKFLGRVELELNQQYNALIGGRGTGKSTLLEYARWGLCDQPVDDSDPELGPVQIKRGKLIADTLQRFDGEVVVTVFVNGVKHIVKRSSKTNEILLKVGTSPFAAATEEEVRTLFPIQAYSQKQLSSVAVRIDELRRFVELPIKSDLDEIAVAVHDAKAKLRNAYMKLVRKRELEIEIAGHAVETDSLTKQLISLRAKLKGLSAADQETIDAGTKMDNEEAIVGSLANDLEQAHGRVTELAAALMFEDPDEQAEVVNTELIDSIRVKYANKFAQISDAVDSLLALFADAASKQIGGEVKKWEKLKADFDKQYEAAKAKAKVNRQQLEAIRSVEKRIREVKVLSVNARNALTGLAEPEKAYRSLRRTWDSLHTRRIEAIEAQCEQFSELSHGLIRAGVRDTLAVDSLKSGLRTAFAGLNIREAKIDDLCQVVAGAADPVAAWNEILEELEALALYDAGAAGALPPTKILGSCSFVQGERARLAQRLEPKGWLELSLVDVEFDPAFEYCTNKDTAEYIAFTDASAGQQATALLTVLLNQSGAPLIIDQPEDDIDSKWSAQIVEQIWKAKAHRQIIVASHNANLVVNGDAELVVCCDYINAGDQTGGQIKMAGAIDNREVKSEITLVTEGGSEAFKLRKEKYGF
jgi:type III restriction enzyme